MEVDRLLARGGEAPTLGRWREAAAALEAALAGSEDATALLGLADARWWLGDAGACSTWSAPSPCCAPTASAPWR